MTFDILPESSTRHKTTASHRRPWIAFTLAWAFAAGGVVLTNGCDRTPEGSHETAVAAPGAIADHIPTVGPSSTPAAASPAIAYISSPDPGQALVSGTSTLHAWTVKANIVKGHAEFSEPLKPGSAIGITLQSIELAIPVESLKSTEGSGMDKTMYEALKLKEFPTITYTLTKASLKTSLSKQDPAYHFDTTGQLTVAGGAHPVNLDLAVTPLDGGRLTITTNIGLKMTDFGMKPPTAMLGVIKSGDAVTVKVTWELMMRPPAAGTGK